MPKVKESTVGTVQNAILVLRPRNRGLPSHRDIFTLQTDNKRKDLSMHASTLGFLQQFFRFEKLLVLVQFTFLLCGGDDGIQLD